MNHEIRITPASPADAREINTVLYTTWLDTYPNKEVGITKDDIEETYKDVFTEERIKAYQVKLAHTPEDRKTLVAKEGAMVVGVSTILRREKHNILKTLYILPQYQRKGIGSMLWDEGKKFCDPQKDTILEVATYNQKAISFYKKLGFVDTGKRYSDEKWRMKSGAIIPEMEMVLKSITP